MKKLFAFLVLILMKIRAYCNGRLCTNKCTWCFHKPKHSISFKNSLIIHEENTKKNHKRVVSLYVDKDFPSFT